jgi:hypothetical protein
MGKYQTKGKTMGNERVSALVPKVRMPERLLCLKDSEGLVQ